MKKCVLALLASVMVYPAFAMEAPIQEVIVESSNEIEPKAFTNMSIQFTPQLINPEVGRLGTGHYEIAIRFAAASGEDSGFCTWRVALWDWETNSNTYVSGNCRIEDGYLVLQHGDLINIMKSELTPESEGSENVDKVIALVEAQADADTDVWLELDRVTSDWDNPRMQNKEPYVNVENRYEKALLLMNITLKEEI